MNALNRIFDQLPRTRFGARSRSVPVFRSCGIAGYYAALIVTFGCGLCRSLSLLTLAGVAAVCGLSFFAWALLRRSLFRREEIVLLEHVWFAQLCSAAFLTVIGEPVLTYLDAVAVGLCVFLAAGRVGCLMVGCCHGRPASVGIVYGEPACADGFSRHLAGARLFPVQAIEAGGLLAIGLACAFAQVSTAPGTALAFFLVAYSVLRFGLEGLRGDRRPHLLGLSQARWMALLEIAFALWLLESRRGALEPVPRTLAPAALLLLLLLATLIGKHFGREQRMLRRRHREELAALLLDARGGDGALEVRCSSLGVSLALSSSEEPGQLHLSLGLRDGPPDLALLCALADAIAPRAAVAHVAPGPVLHLLLPRTAREGGSDGGLRLFGAAVRLLQHEAQHAELAPFAPEAEPAAPPAAVRARHSAPIGDELRESYFARRGA